MPLISWPRFDPTDTSYAIAVLADLTPAWRELYVEILDALLSRYVTWWGALDWMRLKGRDPGVIRGVRSRGGTRAAEPTE